MFLIDRRSVGEGVSQRGREDKAAGFTGFSDEERGGDDHAGSPGDGGRSDQEAEARRQTVAERAIAGGGSWGGEVAAGSDRGSG